MVIPSIEKNHSFFRFPLDLGEEAPFGEYNYVLENDGKMIHMGILKYYNEDKEIIMYYDEGAVSFDTYEAENTYIYDGE